MLIEFTVENFKCFKDSVTLSMVADESDSAHAECLIPAGDIKLLPVALIFGSNASGKSTLLEALQLLLSSVELFGDKPLAKKFHASIKRHFENTDPVKFSIQCWLNNQKHEYTLSLNDLTHSPIEDSNGSKWRISKEKYSIDDEMLFERKDSSTISAGTQFDGGQSKALGILAQTPPGVTFLSTASRYGLSCISPFTKWCNQELVKPLFEDDENSLKEILKDIEKRQSYKDYVLNLLHGTNAGITDITISEDAAKNETLSLTHTLTNKDSNLSLHDESAGTQKLLLKSYGLYFVTKQTCRPVIIDELNDRFHPWLERIFIQQFQDPVLNQQKSQLICATHNVLMFDIAFLRKDQLCIVEKDTSAQESTLYKLSDFELAKSNSRDIIWQFYSGQFGGTPPNFTYPTNS